VSVSIAEPRRAPAPVIVVADDERDLVDRLRRGEAAAFDRVYARYRQRIYGFLARLAGRRDLADDLFQETFLKLATHATRLAEETDLAAWLFTVARNAWRSHLRWTLFDLDRRRALAWDEPDAPPSPHDRATATEDRRRLERALAKLSPADREVLLLVGVEGLPQDQVAGILGMKHDAVRQRVARARARLAELMQEKP
jgi:RNA polymerase sigma-70 factor (ECF subfamily)